MTRYSISLTNDQWRTGEHLENIQIKTRLDDKKVEDFTDSDFDVVVILRMVQAARKDFGDD